ncbi:MAG: helix-turn-helix transcriptional regulator [Clostridia bacterium]|nr:helix-turn-helix transcriptional regulator [Clostridia bacterium]
MNNFVKQNFEIKNVVRARIVPANKKAPSKMKRHYYVFIFYHGCEKTYKFKDGKTLHTKNNDILFLPKDSEYTVTCTKLGETYSINFELYEEMPLSPFVFRPKNSTAFFEYFKSAESAWRKKYTGYEMRLKAEAYNVICNMIKEYELDYVGTKSNDRLKPALDYIHSNYNTDLISIGTLATLCGMSEVSFRKIFTNSMGITPIKYINSLKIASAKELLLSKSCTVAKAAELSGFKCDSYFSREFKKYTGMSPTEYKNSID